MKRPLRILLINNFHYIRGGDCRYTFDLAHLLREHGHKVVHFSMHHPQNDPYEYDRYFVSFIDYDAIKSSKHPQDMARVVARSFWSREAQEKLEALLRVFRPDVAHCQNILHHLTPSVIATLRKHAIPVVHTLHDYNLICPDIYCLQHGKICEECFGGRYWRCVLHRCKKGSLGASILAVAQRYVHDAIGAFEGLDRFIAPSMFLMRKFQEAGFRYSDRIVQIPLFIEDLEGTMYKDKKKEIGGALFVGRLSSQKGIPTLLKAARLIPDISITLAGQGELYSYVQEAIGRDGLSNVHLVGHQPREVIFDLQRRSRCFVLPSECYENLPVAVMEAKLLGCPPIVSGGTAMEEMVEDGVTGLIFKMGDPQSLAGQIRRLCSNGDLAARMGVEARRRALEEYAPERHYERIMEVYTQVIGDTDDS
jgi:glycosyltransferase involved in cell wall biosynthesis